MTFGILQEASQVLEKVLREYSSSRKSVEMKDTAARYSTDVILSVAFGIEANSLKNSRSEFRNLSKLLLDNIDANTILIFLLFKVSPENFFLFQQKEGQFRNETIEKFFTNSLYKVVEYREKNNIHRNDFLELYFDLKTEEDWTKDRFNQVKATKLP